MKANFVASAFLALFGAAMVAGGVVTCLAGAGVGVLVALSGGALALFSVVDIHHMLKPQAPGPTYRKGRGE